MHEVIQRVLEDKMAFTLEKELEKKDKYAWNYDHEEVGELSREVCEAIQHGVKGDNAPPPAGPRARARRAAHARAGGRAARALAAPRRARVRPV